MMRKVSALLRNACPLCSGMGVRFKSEWVSVLLRNHCPLSPGMGVRFAPEFALLKFSSIIILVKINSLINNVYSFVAGCYFDVFLVKFSF